MLVADTYFGSLADDDVAGRIDAAEPLRVVLDDTDRRRSRVRTTTVNGTDLGIIVGRELRDKDVLVARDKDSGDDDHLVVVELDGIPAVALSFDDVNYDVLPSAVALGHAVGNRHRDLAVANDRVLIRAEQDPNRLESLLAAHLPDGATATRTTVSPAAFGSDASHTHTSSDHSHALSGHHASEHDHPDHSRSHDHNHSDDDHPHAQDEAGHNDRSGANDT